MSSTFRSAMFGIAMTLFSWYGPWAWPAAPAFFVLEKFFGGSYHELPFAGRAAVLVLLIIVNVAAWGAVGWLMTRPLGLYRRVKFKS